MARIQERKLRKRSRRPRARGAMTATQAVRFEARSKRSAGKVACWIRQNGCDCSPYEDVFTAKRWRAQGLSPKFMIQPLTFTTSALGRLNVDPRVEEYAEGIRKSDPKEYKRAIASMSPWKKVQAQVWCRCQVEPVKTSPFW